MLIILPVRNESKIISQVVLNLTTFINQKIPGTKLVFIDDHSTDGTLILLKEINSPDVEVIQNNFDCGKGSAIKTALLISRFMKEADEDDFVVLMDGDGQVLPENILQLTKHSDFYNADVVVGSKRHVYSNIRYSFCRRIISNVYNFITRAMFGFNLRDTQCGIKIFRKRVLSDIISKVTVKEFAFDLECMVALYERGYLIVESPVRITAQKNKGSVSFGTILRTAFDTLCIWARKQKGYY